MILSSNGATFEGYAGVKRQQARRCTSKREHDSVLVRIRLKSVPAKHDLTLNFKSQSTITAVLRRIIEHIIYSKKRLMCVELSSKQQQRYGTGFNSVQ